MTTEQKSCDLCDGTQFEIICRHDRRGKPLNTVVCLGCGLVGHESVPTEQELDDYYARSYRQEYHGEERPSNRRIWRSQLKGERVLHQLQPYLPAGSRMFEVGAGLGCTVKVFEMAGYDASGIEIGTSFQRFSQVELNARVEHGSLFDSCAREPFDLVFFMHVIEHLRSPRRALQVIHQLVKPGGLLYLECPSLGKQSGTVAELFHFAHIHTFTPIALLTLLRRCGFEVEKCYSDGIGRNHKFLLRRTEPSACPIDPTGLVQTHELLQRFQQRWHRFGMSYLAGRVKRITQYVREFVWSGKSARRLLDQAAPSTRND